MILSFGLLILTTDNVKDICDDYCSTCKIYQRNFSNQEMWGNSKGNFTVKKYLTGVRIRQWKYQVVSKVNCRWIIQLDALDYCMHSILCCVHILFYRVALEVSKYWMAEFSSCKSRWRDWVGNGRSWFLRLTSINDSPVWSPDLDN